MQFTMPLKSTSSLVLLSRLKHFYRKRGETRCFIIGLETIPHHTRFSTTLSTPSHMKKNVENQPATPKVDEMTLSPDKDTNQDSTFLSTKFKAISDQNTLRQPPRFDDPIVSYEHKSIPQIIQSILVFQLCKVPILVKSANQIIHYSNKLLGQTITNFFIRHTFFYHFCAGEDENDITPTLDKLKQRNIGAILDYAAEDDIGCNNKNDLKRNSNSVISAKTDIITHPPFNQPARLYEYESEQQCDNHVEIFLKCIQAVKKNHDHQHKESNNVLMTRPGFAAIKVTALGNPLLLERISTAIKEGEQLFLKFDHDKDGFISRTEFASAYEVFFDNGSDTLSSLLDQLDPECLDRIDYITFMSQLVTLENLPSLCQHCKAIGPLSMATPSMEEFDLFTAMHERVMIIAKEASDCGVRLLIDAEQSKYQPAIDNLALGLQQIYNDKEKTDVPIIFNTYQAYLKDAQRRIQIDLERSIRFNYHFGAKLVRGAYMVSERLRAKELNQSSPIHSSIEETHNCYNSIVEHLLRSKVNNEKLKYLQIMCATHNQESIQRTLDLMDELKLHHKSHDENTIVSEAAAAKSSSSSSAVHFAQLYGMSDNLTYPLGKCNYSVYKYLPYGQIDEVIPYLVRRVEENSDLLSNNASKEVTLLLDALRMRFAF